jgi:multimeric flavodoxin WrbA
MKTLVILGSRNEKGQTAQAAGALIEGLLSAGGQAERIFLPHLKMERCRQCEDSGWGICLNSGRCVIDDDFPLVVSKIHQADAVIFATPVYFSDLSESLRAFLDRFRRTSWQGAGKDKISGKPAIGICVAGGGGGGAPKCAASLEQVLSICGFDVLDLIPVRRQNLEMKRPILKATGHWLESGFK